MIRISQLKLDIDFTPEDLVRAIVRKLRIHDTGLLDYQIIRQSIDSRAKGNTCYSLTVDVRVRQEKTVLHRLHDPGIVRSDPVRYRYPDPGTKLLEHRPVVIGSGPAGLFAAYLLAEKGYRPVIIERGEPVEERIKKVQAFWENGNLCEESNIQFGEGGAGTFSDGKLNTGVKDPAGRKEFMLQVFIRHGAPKEIQYLNKPHIGTDVLRKILVSMRRQILHKGGEYRFSSRFTSFETKEGKVAAVWIEGPDHQSYRLPADCVVLAIGHSSRDTFDYLIRQSPLKVQAKAFAVGVRAEHRQADINKAQYQGADLSLLPPADYKLTCHTSSGRSVYTFCMCPGGYVVNSSSRKGYQCINGMSYSARDSANANSAIVAAVQPSDDPEENIRFQMEIERKAFQAGQGRIVSQRLEDFEKGQVSADYGSIKPLHKGLTVLGDIHQILPQELCQDIREAIHLFGRRITGFDDPDVILSAVETRTSSPVRILRNDQMESCIEGIYPAGEGAGYAGGITSAALDGIRIFEKISSRYAPVVCTNTESMIECGHYESYIAEQTE